MNIQTIIKNIYVVIVSLCIAQVGVFSSGGPVIVTEKLVVSGALPVSSHTLRKPFPLVSSHRHTLNPSSLFVFPQRSYSTKIAMQKRGSMMFDVTKNTPSQGYRTLFSHAINDDDLCYAMSRVKKQALKREEDFLQTHFMFYHAQSVRLKFFTDVCNTVLCALGQRTSGSIGLRLPHKDLLLEDIASNYVVRAREIIMNELIEKDIIFDHVQPYQRQLISANIVLDGNHGNYGESTWNYFESNYSCTGDIDNLLREACIHFGIEPTTHLMSRFYEITSKYKDGPGVLYQIAIPQSIVDDVVYLSHQGGLPYSSKLYQEISNGEKKEVDGYNESKHCYTKISPLLNVIASDSRSLPLSVIRRLQARLIVGSSLFNFSQGIKVYTYSGRLEDQESSYEKDVCSMAGTILDLRK